MEKRRQCLQQEKKYFRNISLLSKPLQTLLNGQLPAPDSELPTHLGGGTDLYVQKHDEMVNCRYSFSF